MSSENKTEGIKNKGFFKIEADSQKEETSIGKVDQAKKSKRDGLGQLPSSITEAVRGDFPTSFFVLTLVGYIIVEAFGESGINFKEYLILIFILGIITYYLNFSKADSFWDEAFNLINRKIYAIIVVGFVLIDIIYNHSSLIDKIILLIKNL